MNAIELINFIKQQPLISHAVPVLVNGEQVNGIQLVEDLQCGYVFNIICNGVHYRKTKGDSSSSK